MHCLLPGVHTSCFFILLIVLVVPPEQIRTIMNILIHDSTSLCLSVPICIMETVVCTLWGCGISLLIIILDHPFPTFSSPWAPLPAAAQLGESSHQLITWVGAPPRPLPGPAEAQKPLGEISFADRAKNNRFRAFLFFGVVYF